MDGGLPSEPLGGVESGHEGSPDGDQPHALQVGAPHSVHDTPKRTVDSDCSSISSAPKSKYLKLPSEAPYAKTGLIVAGLAVPTEMYNSICGDDAVTEIVYFAKGRGWASKALGVKDFFAMPVCVLDEITDAMSKSRGARTNGFWKVGSDRRPQTEFVRLDVRGRVVAFRNTMNRIAVEADADDVSHIMKCLYDDMMKARDEEGRFLISAASGSSGASGQSAGLSSHTSGSDLAIADTVSDTELCSEDERLLDEISELCQSCPDDHVWYLPSKSSFRVQGAIDYKDRKDFHIRSTKKSSLTDKRDAVSHAREAALKHARKQQGSTGAKDVD